MGERVCSGVVFRESKVILVLDPGVDACVASAGRIREQLSEESSIGGIVVRHALHS